MPDRQVHRSRCKFCGGEYTRTPGTNQSYCCRAHRQRAYEARRKQLVAKDMVTREYHEMVEDLYVKALDDLARHPAVREFARERLERLYEDLHVAWRSTRAGRVSTQRAAPGAG